ncbi:MAG: hypothetical protein SCH71_15060 [Desulfobulbaceae bacterium]|nr:hypothetical protein [Desulfobulbaceae bacterium]
MYHRFVIVISILFLFAGCYSKPVRHLASDASLIKKGESTRQEVLRYLGEPDGQRTVAPGVEEYIYSEDMHDPYQRTPVVGSWFGAKGYEILLITFTGDLVTDMELRTFRKKDRNWEDDFSWQDAR